MTEWLNWLNGLVISPTFVNLRLNFAIMNSWFNHSQLPPGLVLADCIEFPSSAAKNIINNQSDFSIDHLVMSMCRVFSCVVGAVCLLWPGHSLRKTLLSFALFLFVLQGQSYLLLQVSLDFLLLHSHPLWWKGLFFAVSSRSCQRWQWQPTPVLLPGKSHKRRNLVGCSPWGRRESDMTEVTNHKHEHFLGAERTMVGNYSLLWLSLSTSTSRYKMFGNLHQHTKIMTSGNSDSLRNESSSPATNKEALLPELLA